MVQIEGYHNKLQAFIVYCNIPIVANMQVGSITLETYSAPSPHFQTNSLYVAHSRLSLCLRLIRKLWVSRNFRGNVQIWGYAACSARSIPPNLGVTPAIPRELKLWAFDAGYKPESVRHVGSICKSNGIQDELYCLAR